MVDLLFFELMLNLSRVKQMFIQPIQPTRIEIVYSKLSGTPSCLSQSLCTLNEVAAHLPGWHAHTKEAGFGFCQQHLEFPSSLLSKYYPGPMQLNVSFQNGTGVSSCWLSIPLFKGKFFSLSSLSGLLLIDFDTHHLRAYYCFLFGTQGKHLSRWLSSLKPWAIIRLHTEVIAHMGW